MKAKICKTGNGFMGAMQYALHGRRGEQEKNGRVICTNMTGKTEHDLAAEFNFVWKQRPDIKKPVWTGSLNLKPGEAISDQKWGLIARRFLTGMGFDLSKHQYTVVFHNDKNHKHVHFVVNRIAMDGTVYLNQRSARAAIALTERLEKIFGLQVTKAYSVGASPTPALSNGEYQMSARTGAEASRLQAAAIVCNARASSRSFTELIRNLQSKGIKLTPNGTSGSVGGASFEFHGVHYTGSKLGKECAWKSLSTAVGYDETVDASLVAELRAVSETATVAAVEFAAINFRKKTLTEVIDSANLQLFMSGKRTSVTRDQFEHVIIELKKLLSEYAKDAESELTKQMIAIGKNESGTPVFTSADILKRESCLIRSAQLLATDTHHDLGRLDVDSAITANSYEFLNKESIPVELSLEQRSAIRENFESGYIHLGDAIGPDTAFALGCLRIGYEQHAYQVLGASAAGCAAAFERRTSIESRTIAKLLSDIQFSKIVLDRKTLIVLDDASKLDSKSVADVVALCDKAGAKLVTTGHDRLFMVAKGMIPSGADGQMAAEVLMAYEKDYFAKKYGAGPDATLRARRDEAMDAPMEDEDVDAPIESFAEALKSGETELFGTESAVTMDRFEEAMMEIEELAPNFSAGVRAQILADLQPCGKDDGGFALFTTREILEREETMIRDVRRMSRDVHHNLTDAEILAAIRKKEKDSSMKIGRTVIVTEEQSAAVNWAFSGGYASLQGSAGTGKSFAMEIIKIGYELRGYKVYGAAVSRRASVNLEDETGIKSFTFAKLLSDIKRGNIKLDHKTCLVIDEAGQVGTGYLSSLVHNCSESGAKIVFTGEDKQLDAIQHGGALRFLSRSDIVGTARIEAIQRQEDDWAKQAIMDYRDGRMDAGLAAFEARGLVTMKRGGVEATQEALVKDWRKHELDVRAAHAADPSKPQRQSLILAHSNANARALGDLVRTIRKEEGVITGPEYTLKAAHGDKAYALALAAGDRIRFNKNDERGLGVINGSLGTILSIEEVPSAKKGKSDYLVRALTDDHREIEFNASEYADEKGRVLLGQAYAMTVYSSQGVTVNGDVFVLQSAGMDRANTYVAHSRAKMNTHTYVDRDSLAASGRYDDSDEFIRERLLRTMSRESTKRLATEHLSLTDSNYIENTFGANVDEDTDAARRERFSGIVKGPTEDENVRVQFAREAKAKRLGMSVAELDRLGETFKAVVEKDDFVVKAIPDVPRPARPAMADPMHVPRDTAQPAREKGAAVSYNKR